jgi:mannosyltransferase OCH1-like enzyme
MSRILRAIKKVIKPILEETPSVFIYDRNSNSPNARQQKIPLNCYQTWKNNLFGKTHSAEIQEFRNINPEINFFLYDDRKQNEYMQKSWGTHPIYEIFENSCFGAMKADIFRYCIIYEKGGYYFDINKGCDCNITELHPADAQEFITYENNPLVLIPNLQTMRTIDYPLNAMSQCLFGFTKKHPILERTISNIVEYSPYFKAKTFASPRFAIISFTGPGMFTKSVREVLDEKPASSVFQISPDLNGHAISNMPGSDVRYRQSPSYTSFENCVILR